MTNVVADQFGRPAKITNAVKLLYFASLVIGGVRAIFEYSTLAKQAHLSFLLFVWGFVFGFLWLLIHKIATRRNWARYTLLVFFIIGIPLSAPLLTQSLSVSPASGILGIIQILIQAIALVMLFQRESNAWFKNPAIALTPINKGLKFGLYFFGTCIALLWFTGIIINSKHFNIIQRNPKTTLRPEDQIQEKTPRKFVSDSGEFSIDFPPGSPLPKKEEATLKTDYGPVVATSHVAPLENTAYFVHCLDYPNELFKHKSREQILKDTAEGSFTKINLKISKFEDINTILDFGPIAKRVYGYGLYNGVQTTVRTDVILSKNRLYMISVISADKNLKTDPTSINYFNSFRIIDPQPSNETGGKPGTAEPPKNK